MRQVTKYQTYQTGRRDREKERRKERERDGKREIEKAGKVSEA